MGLSYSSVLGWYYNSNTPRGPQTVEALGFLWVPRARYACDVIPTQVLGWNTGLVLVSVEARGDTLGRFLWMVNFKENGFPQGNQIEKLRENHCSWIPLVVQWLRLCICTSNEGMQRVWICPLNGKLRSHMLCGMAKKKKKHLIILCFLFFSWNVFHGNLDMQST